MMNMKLWAFLLAASLAACRVTVAEGEDEHGHKAEPQHGEHAEHAEHEGEHGEEQEEAIRLTPEVMAEFGIEIAEAGPGNLTTQIALPGEIAVNQDRQAHIVPRFPGIVKEVRKNLGEEVKAGEVLAVLESNESLAPYELLSLLDGTVIEKHITLGEALQDDHPAFVVADLSTVWVNLSVYQKDLQTVREGLGVIVSVGHNVTEGDGRISYISPLVDEHTRTALARVVLPNPDGRWRPGMFVTASVAVDDIAVPLVVPRTAIQTVEDKPSVFVQTDEGFEPQHITTGRSNETHIEVIDGLAPGTKFVARGAFTLKAQMSKSAFGDGHNH